MPRRKVAMPYRPPTQSPLSPLETRWGLMTYTLYEQQSDKARRHCR